MSVKTKRALWLGSAVTFAFAGLATISTAWADEKADQPLDGVKVTAGVQIAQSSSAPPPPEEAKPEEKKVERVVVTGSRLKKNEFTSSSPIQVITREETTLEGLNDTSDILQGSTLAAGSQQLNNTFGGFVTQGGPGANTLSLRGLGAQRTLVLINGRRAAPAGTRGQVGQADLNTIPESMIDRIEILKDGGSSIYGSDAVAGVVNIITRKNVDGLEFSASTNYPFESGGESWQGTALWGETFDRGHFMLVGEYYRREELVRTDRDYFSCEHDLAFQVDGPSLGFGQSTVGIGNLLDFIGPNGESRCFPLGTGVGTITRTPTLGIGNATGTAVLANAAQTVAQRLLLAEERFQRDSRFIPNASSTPGGGTFLNDIAGWKRVRLSYQEVAHQLYGTPLVTNAGAALSATAVYNLLTAAQRADVEAKWRQTQVDQPQATDDPRFGDQTVIAPVTRYAFFGEGSYDLFPGVEAYTELAFVRRESEQHRFRQFFPNVCGRGQEAIVANGISNLDQGYGSFLPFGLTAICTGSNANNPFGNLANSTALIPTDSSQVVDFYRGVLGIKGDLGEKVPLFGSWSYDVYVQHSRSEGEYINDVIMNDRVNATTGPGTCIQANITISGGNCSAVPTGIHWFDPNWVSRGIMAPNEAAFLFTKEASHTTYSQTLANGVITGDVWQAPYGMISGALGFEARRDEIDDTPGFNQRNNNLWGQSSAGRTAGSDSVVEFFSEVSIPLLAGLKFAEDLTLDASARYTTYDSYGDGSTYKLGLNYQITPEYRLRGTTGTSFRAPALFELFLANLTGFTAQSLIDPCINWQNSSNPNIVASCGPGGIGLPSGYAGLFPSATVLTGGGHGLTAETSEARTLGFIWTPDWIDLSIALDYFEFEVNNEVAQFGAANIVAACHTQAPILANPFCDLFQRDKNPLSSTFGMIQLVNNSYTNISNQTTDGLDLTTRYEHEFSFGKLLINGQFTWTFTDEVRTFITSPTTDFGGTVFDADFTGNVDIRFDWTDWTFFWNIDMASRASNDEQFGGNLFIFRASPFVGAYKQYTEFVATHDASARYRADDWSITFGLQNVFDEEPPAVSAGSIGSLRVAGDSVALGGPYDLLGRRAFVEITKEF